MHLMVGSILLDLDQTQAFREQNRVGALLAGGGAEAFGRVVMIHYNTESYYQKRWICNRVVTTEFSLNTETPLCTRPPKKRVST